MLTEQNNYQYVCTPKHPIITIWNNRIQNDYRIAKKVCFDWWTSVVDPYSCLITCIYIYIHSLQRDLPITADAKEIKKKKDEINAAKSP